MSKTIAGHRATYIEALTFVDHIKPFLDPNIKGSICEALAIQIEAMANERTVAERSAYAPVIQAVRTLIAAHLCHEVESDEWKAAYYGLHKAYMDFESDDANEGRY